MTRKNMKKENEIKQFEEKYKSENPWVFENTSI